MIMMMMIMMTMIVSDLKHLHDAKHKLLSFLYENDCSLTGFEIYTAYISIMLLFY